MVSIKSLRSARRSERLRLSIRKKSSRLRLCVTKTSRHLYAQIIDDTKGRTLVSASSLEKSVYKSNVSSNNAKMGVLVGANIANRAAEIGIKDVVFDRGSKKYHGVIATLADSARAKLNF